MAWADWGLLSEVAGVIVPNKDTPPPLPTPKESPVSECSWCKTPVKPDWKICQECGTPLEKDDNIKQVCIHCEGLVTHPDDQTGDIIECPHCKKRIQLRGRREYDPGPPNWSDSESDNGLKGSSGGGIGIGFEIDF
jgi:DNA-directed RNA polymerase subunit RPC12/RpoP